MLDLKVYLKCGLYLQFFPQILEWWYQGGVEIGQTKKAYEVLVEKPEGKEPLRALDIRVDERMTLKLTLKKQGYCANTPLKLELEFFPLIEPLLYLSGSIIVVDLHFVCFTASLTSHTCLSFCTKQIVCRLRATTSKAVFMCWLYPSSMQTLVLSVVYVRHCHTSYSKEMYHRRETER